MVCDVARARRILARLHRPIPIRPPALRLGRGTACVGDTAVPLPDRQGEGCRSWQRNDSTSGDTAGERNAELFQARLQETSWRH